MKYSISALALLCPLLTLAQPAGRPLSVGDTIGDLEMKNLVNYTASSVRLSQLRGRAVILDFWATWCSNCLYGMPKLDSLQRRYGHRLQVLLVTDQPAAVVTAFFQKNKRAAATPLPVVTGDTVLRRLFPHGSIPHAVWIDASGRVKAITAPKYLTGDNVEKLVAGTLAALPLKKDQLAYDPSRPLLENGNGGPAAYAIKTTWTGHLPGLGRRAARRKDDTGTRQVFINHPALLLYEQALGRNFHNRVVVEASCPERFLADTLDSDTWQARHTWCYEISVPLLTPEGDVKRLMRYSLDGFFGVQGRLECRPVRCYVLRAGRSLDPLRSKGGASDILEKEGTTLYRNLPLSRIVESWNRQKLSYGRYKKPIILDETGYTLPVDLALTAALDPVVDLEGLKRGLRSYGLELVETERELEVFVLGEAAGY